MEATLDIRGGESEPAFNAPPPHTQTETRGGGVSDVPVPAPPGISAPPSEIAEISHLGPPPVPPSPRSGRDIRGRAGPGCESDTGQQVPGQTDRQTEIGTLPPHSNTRLPGMAPLGLVSLLMVTLAALCESQRMGERPARWHPPPVVSFLRQLWGAQRGPLPVAPAPWKPGPAAGAEPRWYVQPEAAGEALGLPRSPRRRTPRQLPPQPSRRGCQLGTCQTHNLFSWLYHISTSDLKDDSRKDMADPMGYGRRRRWAAGRGAPAGT